ncbi:hypothetical protein SKAU_G00323410 [Synaphobranchus kaupii]|uniref:Selenoprotein W n=1 Tax=Synaphobranchus kaupii TaxID=118154 RepID=A0A9Q1EP42_SYNKA|nr:hypothetical protein SKAU_G00323410 [Synaphobranchus kaupii]
MAITLRDDLDDNFPCDLEITSSRISIGGSFEVKVNGRLVHSKKGGEGFVDSEGKMGVIIRAIEKALKK